MWYFTLLMDLEYSPINGTPFSAWPICRKKGRGTGSQRDGKIRAIVYRGSQKKMKFREWFDRPNNIKYVVKIQSSSELSVTEKNSN